jgi:hypothetical protein
MFGLNSRSSDWSSIAINVGPGVTPMGNCYVLKPQQRKQYEKQQETNQNETQIEDQNQQTETHEHHGRHDRSRNTDQFLGRVSHVSLRAHI